MLNFKSRYPIIYCSLHWKHGHLYKNGNKSIVICKWSEITWILYQNDYFWVVCFLLEVWHFEFFSESKNSVKVLVLVTCKDCWLFKLSNFRNQRSAIKWLLAHFIHKLPMRDGHLRSVLKSTIEMDLYEIQRAKTNYLHVYQVDASKHNKESSFCWGGQNWLFT